MKRLVKWSELYNYSYMNATDHQASSYQAVRLLARRIAALYPKVGEARAFYRKPRRPHHLIRAPHGLVVDPDRAFNGLAMKAAATHDAICVLLDVDHLDGSQILARALLENVLLMEWLLLEPIYRLDIYCISPELMKRHFAKVVRHHYSDDALLAAADTFMQSASRQVVDDVFGDNWYKWAQRIGTDGQSVETINLHGMAVELARAGGQDRSFAYDALYFRLSGSVHSTADAVGAFAKLTEHQECFALGHASAGTRNTITLRSANFFMLSALTALNNYAALGLDDAIDQLAASASGEVRASATSP